MMTFLISLCVLVTVFLPVYIITTERKSVYYKAIWSWHKSEYGYMHFPFFYIAFGRDGFVITILFIEILIAWGQAAKKTYAAESDQPENFQFDEDVEYMNANHPKADTTTPQN